MLTLIHIFLLAQMHYNVIECLIPGKAPELTVRTLDAKVIQRKRQDTKDMCRIFTEETKKLEKINNRMKKGRNLRQTPSPAHRRSKRDVSNPLMNLEDAKRVENIVENVYDDLMDQGQKIEYRRRNLGALQNNTVSGRRFDFAPHILSIPDEVPDTYKHGIEDIDFPKPIRFKYSIIPYFINPKTYDAQLAARITNAFDYFEKLTCVRLQRLHDRPTDKESLKNVEWVYITNPTGVKQCVHTNEAFMTKGVHMVVLGYNCMSFGDIIHELMHVLGFPHEHNRPDRDQHVSIMWDNIKPGYKKYFERTQVSYDVRTPYDYESILHYPARAFSKNGQPTIKTQNGVKIGQRDGLSEKDVEKVNQLYSSECLRRNRHYLMTTCPSVVTTKTEESPKRVTKEQIDQYYKARLWPYGIFNYKIKDLNYFTLDEIENIKAVIHHIEVETCIEFRDLTMDLNEESSDTNTGSDENEIPGSTDEALDPSDGDEKDPTDGDKEDPTEDDGEDLTEDDEITDEGDEAIESPPEDDTIERMHDNLTGEVLLETGSTSDNNTIDTGGKDLTSALRGARTASKNKKNAKKGKKLKASLKAKKGIKRSKLKGKSLPKKAGKAKSKRNRTRRAGLPPSPSRRHATNILIFSRKPGPGCDCPPPGRPDQDPMTVELADDCFNSVNNLLHLFVHLLGLDHQHNSHDRDSFLHIVWDQMSEDLKQDMQEKLPPAASVGFAYDYQSVMHYPWLQIKNGKTNIMYPIWNDGWAMGNWQGLSSVDVQKINILYKDQCELRRQEAQAAANAMQNGKI